MWLTRLPGGRIETSPAHLADIAQFQFPPIAPEHLPSQSAMIRIIQPWISSEQSLRSAARRIQFVGVAPQIGDSQRRQSMLLRAE
jgi:hypothetical protein